MLYRRDNHRSDRLRLGYKTKGLEPLVGIRYIDTFGVDIHSRFG